MIKEDSLHGTRGVFYISSQSTSADRFLKVHCGYALSTYSGAVHSESPMVRHRLRKKVERVQKLTAKQERFAQAIALEDMNQADAYRSAYDTSRMSDETVWARASELANKSKVAVRVNELRQQALTPKVMSAQKRREKLTELAESEDANIAMKAIDLLNKMDGEYVQKVQADVQQETTINIELIDDAD